MEIFWGVTMTLVGIWLFASGATKSEALPFSLLVARAQLLWKDRAHSFLAISGLLVSIMGILIAIGSINMQ